MPNYRVYYPLEEVAIGEFCTASGIPVHGVQSVSTTTSFSLEQVFELGQLDIYENIENLPNVEMTISKALDGYPLIYHLGTTSAGSPTLANRSNQRCDIILSIFSDSQDNASGLPLVQAYCSGMYLSSLNYSLPVQGNCTESVTFVGNDKIWISSSGQTWCGKTGFAFRGHFDGTDAPASGIQRRQNVIMGSGESVFPSIIPGVTVVNGSGFNIQTAGVYGAHIQDITISCNLGREDLYELGRRRPYYRYANFPTAVDCTINTTVGGNTPGDMINAVADSTANISNEPIRIELAEGTVFDLGTRNKLQSVTTNGGDAGGGVQSLAFTFQNFNFLTVTSTNDPEGL